MTGALATAVLALAPLSAADAPACFGLDQPRAAVVLSSQDLLLSLPSREVLVRTDGPCAGLLAAGEVWLRPAAAGGRFCGRGDAVEVGGARCGVAEMVEVVDSGRDCFRSDRLRAWSLLGLDRLRVDTRGGSFEVTLAGSCPDLSLTDSIRFRSQRGLREICGGRNDQVLPQPAALAPGTLLGESQARRDGGSGFACTIRSVQRLSRR